MTTRKPSENGFVLWLIIILLGLVLLLVLPALFFFVKPLAPAPVTMTMPQGAPAVASEDLIAEDVQTDQEPLRPAHPWIGYVGDALARPIAGARVTLGTPPEEGAPLAITDDRGKFVLLVPPEQFPLVTIEADGYYQIVAELEERGSGTYTLYRGGLLQGQVRGHIFVLTGSTCHFFAVLWYST